MHDRVSCDSDCKSDGKAFIGVKVSSERHKRSCKQIIAHVLLAVFLITMILGVLYVGIDGIRNGLGYWQLAARYIVLLYVMKAFDIIVQDQWLVMTVGYVHMKSCKPMAVV